MRYRFASTVRALADRVASPTGGVEDRGISSFSLVGDTVTIRPRLTDGEGGLGKEVRERAQNAGGDRGRACYPCSCFRASPRSSGCRRTTCIVCSTKLATRHQLG